MESIIADQFKIYEAIYQLLTNFKKDGAERKTPEYIKRRLDALDSYWREFQGNHVTLCKYEDRSDQYFQENLYQKASDLYLSSKEKIAIYQPKPITPAPEQTKTSSLPSFSVEDTGTVSTRSQGNNSKLDEMLKKQSSHLRAFSRNVSNIDIDQITEKWEFEDALKTLQDRWSKIDQLHLDIDSELNGSNEEYQDTFAKNEIVFMELKKEINRKISATVHREKSTPKMTIPDFSGNYQQWVSFKDLFVETIHNNASMSNAQKMQFLKSKVRGEADSLIQHLKISSDNYDASWRILNERYNNTKLIFYSHLDILFNLSTMKQQSADQIKRLHDNTNECIFAIENLGINVSTWGPLLVYILSKKLDTDTHNDYVDSLRNPKALPTLSDFMNFLEKKFTALESARRKQENPVQKHSSWNNYSNNKSNYINKQSLSSNNKVISQSSHGKSNSLTKYKCPLCNQLDHGLYYCKQFLDMPPYLKRKTVNKLNLCQNCLYSHNGKACFSDKRCRHCNGTHNTILHEACVKPSTWKHEQQNEVKTNTHVSLQHEIPEILLATGIIKVKTYDGTYRQMRILIDQGSMTSLISDESARLLGLPRQKCKGVISGVGAKESNCKGVVTLACQSMYNDFTFETDAYIMRDLIKNLPTYTFPKPAWTHLDSLQLADPEFYSSRPVDILLGADIYPSIILEGICRPEQNLPIAQQTRLGWILSGNVKTLQCNVVLSNFEEIKKFWEVEEISEEQSSLTSEDQHCIELYKNTTKRREDGRFEVRLPLKSDIEYKLGSTKFKAVAQLRVLERKFIKNENIAKEYKLFMSEYLSLGHMRPVVSNMKPDYYLPHHCVLKDDSITTKLRVVFNGSAPGSAGPEAMALSLNDLMYRGPNLQVDLQTLLITWRQYPIAFTADIEKMYRCIFVNEEDQKYQKIVWRNSQAEPLKEYMLTTVTYGTKAAPFLAMMTLKHLASEERQKLSSNPSSVSTEERKYQEAALSVLEEKFYMDDLIHGCYSSSEAHQLQKQLISLLRSGGFNLRKWKSNSLELLQDVDKNENFDFKQGESTKTLGLTWNPKQDYFTFQSKIGAEMKNTKRTLLSGISKLFDPLGWLTPLSTKLKLLFQNVWLSNIEWDEQLPENIVSEWLEIKKDISTIDQIKLERWIRTKQGDTIELHGFCDSSTRAMACVIYCKIDGKDGNPASVILVAGKSRLVPASKQLSVPRLELSSAHLLARLMSKVKQALSSFNIKQYGWSDSMVTLGWLQGDPGKWKPFVANRVKQITDIMPAECWKYVKSAENPADGASRGLTAAQLKEHSLWWQGPAWLPFYQSESNTQKQIFETDQEIKKCKQVYVTRQQSEKSIIYQLLIQYSSITKVIHVFARILRILTRKEEKPKHVYLSLKEIRKARTIIIKFVQQKAFETEIRDLKQGKQVNPKSSISNLNPTLDQEGVLRVSGRLKNAQISTDMKFPIIIPKDNRFTELLINFAHKVTFHGGPRLVLSFIRQRYWIISGNRVTKKWIRSCVKCRRQAPGKQDQLMGDLPDARCNPSRPFYHTGVDFTGFITLKANKGRGIKTTKGYIAVFVCMATKAVHIELVSDLTSSSFLAALRRMAARRGTPGHMYSDNGTNFVGANNILQLEYEQLKQIFNESLLQEISEMEISWHFNAPAWPSASGLMESGVKRLKYHLKRVIGDQKLTFEELSTVLSQIEACLNSRPLCPLSENPDDDCLTPAHFLASGPTLTIYETEKDARTRWQLAQKVFQDVWKRWKSEYLTQLQTRSKWTKQKENIKLNDVVIIHDDNCPAGKWPMGRVVEIHPGRDGLVRVVTLKTKNGYMKRPIVKLSVLPVHENEPQSDKQESQPGSNSTKPNHNPRTRTKRSFMSVALSLMFFMSLVSGSQSSYNVTSLREKQRLYFDKISDIQLIRDDWKILVYYDLSPYWQAINAFNKYTQRLEEVCLHIKHQTHCQVLSVQLRHGFSELAYYNGLLLSQQSRARSRQTRGLINGVGYVANSLFGILDQNFAEKYEQDITLIHDNQDHLALLWKNQTSVIESEYNLLKRTEDAMNKQEKIMNQYFLTLEKTMLTLNKNIQDESNINGFTLEALTASNMFQCLKNIQTTLLDTVTDIYHGRFNPHIVTPDQLRKELSIISSQISKDLSLPIRNIQTDLRSMYQLLSVKARMTENFLFFEINIPLVSRESYEILKIVSIPELVSRNMLTIKPVSEYVALNIRKDVYVELSETEVRACIYQDEGTGFCRFHKPIYNMKGDENLCQQDQKSNHCKMLISPCENRWTELNKPNHYLYFCCDSCQLRIMCEDQVTARRLTSAGVISIDHGCIIKTINFTVHAHKQYINSLHTMPDIILPDMSPMNNIINISIPNLVITNESTDIQQQLLKIHESITLMKSEEPLTKSISHHDVHHYIAIYVVGAIIIIGAAVFYQRIRRRWPGAAASPPVAVTEVELGELPVAALRPRPDRQCQCGKVISEKKQWQSESDIVKVQTKCNDAKRDIRWKVEKGTSPIFVTKKYEIKDF